MRISGKGQVTIPPAMRKRHGLLPRAEVALVDQPDGVLVVRASKPSRGRRALSALLGGRQNQGPHPGLAALDSWRVMILVDTSVIADIFTRDAAQPSAWLAGASGYKIADRK